jgi:hypothetical protein
MHDLFSTKISFCFYENFILADHTAEDLDALPRLSI